MHLVQFAKNRWHVACTE